MSDLTATNCGCNNVSSNNGCGSWIWILILLFCCGGNNGCDNGCGCGGFGNFFNGNNGGGCGCESIIWILILLSCCGGNSCC